MVIIMNIMATGPGPEVIKIKLFIMMIIMNKKLIKQNN